MSSSISEISVKGQIVRTPSLNLDNRVVITQGDWVKVARVHDEFFLPGQVVSDPEHVLTQLKGWDIKPDIFTFTQKLNDPKPRFPYPYEWDNFAVLHISTYEDWLRNVAKKDVKENLRRAKREGVTVKRCSYDDDFVRGVKALYDETPLRQGRPFWHHGKSFEKVKRENGTYLDRSEYIGAFFENELIGFIKMVYIDDIAKTMQVITKDRYFSKRPANAMIAKAVEVCAENGIKYFNYGPFDYPGKKENSLTEFKRRHGFVRVDFPRYYVPLTTKGRIYFNLGLHRGMKRFIPTKALTFLLGARANLYRRFRSAGRNPLARAPETA